MALNVQMHIIGMEGVGARAEHGFEPAARRHVNRPEIERFVGARLMCDQNAPLVVKFDRDEVRR
jgi:hypothetical protein